MNKSWKELIIGALLLISPWTLGFSDISLARWCNVLFGLILILINVSVLFPDPAIKETAKTKNNVEKK